MGAMKRFCESISEDMGYHGAINNDVMRRADMDLATRAYHERINGYTFQVWTIKGLLPSTQCRQAMPPRDGVMVFLVDSDGQLVEHYDRATAERQRSDFQACRSGEWVQNGVAYHVAGPSPVEGSA